MESNTNSSVPASTPLEKAAKALESPASASNEVSKEVVSSTPKAPEAPKQDEQVSSKFALLARKEKEIMKKAKEFQAKEQSYKEREASFLKYEQLKSSAKSNPLKVLEEYGLTYKDVTDFILNDNVPTPDLMARSLDEKFEAYKREQEQEKLSAMEQAKLAEEERLEGAVSSFKEEIKAYVAYNAEEYELITLYGAQDVIYETIESYYEAHGKVLSKEEGSKLVEDYLFKQTQQAQATKKFKPKEEAKPVKKDVPEAGFTKTLTNEYTSTAPSMLPSKTENDRIKRALAALEKA